MIAMTIWNEYHTSVFALLQYHFKPNEAIHFHLDMLQYYSYIPSTLDLVLFD